MNGDVTQVDTAIVDPVAPDEPIMVPQPISPPAAPVNVPEPVILQPVAEEVVAAPVQQSDVVVEEVPPAPVQEVVPVPVAPVVVPAEVTVKPIVEVLPEPPIEQIPEPEAALPIESPVDPSLEQPVESVQQQSEAVIEAPSVSEPVVPSLEAVAEPPAQIENPETDGVSEPIGQPDRVAIEQTPQASDIPPAVLALSDAELRIAVTYYLKKNQTSISQRGVKARQEKMQKNLSAITNYIATHPETRLPRIAKALNFSPNLTSHYIQMLTKQGKVRAEGWAGKRRYFLVG